VRLSALVLPLLLLTPRGPSQPQPQPAQRKADSLVGEVTAIAGRQLTLRPDNGDAVTVAIDEKASLLRAKPGATNLAEASPLALEELAVGDRVLVRGRLSDDKTSLAARQVVVMSQGDIAKKREAEQADWRKRGILGVVTAVDAAKGEITLQPRRFGAGTPIVLATAGRNVVFRRYAPDSVKFSDAKPSAIAFVQVGDQLRALGDRGPDGAPFQAEQVVFGSFRTVLGDVVSVDAAKGSLAVKVEDPSGTVSVAVSPDTRIRHLPAEMAARMAAPRDAAAGPPGAGAPGTPPAGAAAAAGTGTGGWGGRREGNGGAEDILERLPTATLADLKPGDHILVSSTKGSDASRLHAIAVVSGLEAFRAVAAAPRRGGRGAEVGLPADLMDLGVGLQ
jgi:hypothetical protein